MSKRYPINDQTTPKKDKNAKPSSVRSVKGATVIRVESATHRNSLPFSGTFELAMPEKDPRIFQNKLCAEVVCAWHDKKPLTSYPHIQIRSKYEIVYGYAGEVVDNIS